MNENKILLECYFAPAAGANAFLADIFNLIFDKLKILYPKFEFKNILPNEGICVIPPNNVYGSSGGLVSFQIRNPINNKVIFLSFCDRGIEFNECVDAWAPMLEKYEIVQYIGGLGVSLSNEEIYDKYKIKRFNFLPYLSTGNHRDLFKDCITDYDIDSKERKVCFFTSLYYPRTEICDILVKHPLFEIKTSKRDKSYYADLRDSEYFNAVSKFRMGLSLNGAGEVSIRDFEYFGLNIPCIRPLLLTKFSPEIIPDIHYIPFDFCSPTANQYYSQSSDEIADLIIDKVEKTIDDVEKLKAVSKQANEYYKKYLNVPYLVESFFKICDLDKLI